MNDNTAYNLLKDIQTPDDLRRLKLEQLPEVCNELRQDIIDEVSQNPGHFGSSLGVVELTVALHYVFRTPYDRIVWDVRPSVPIASWAVSVLSLRPKRVSTMPSSVAMPATPSLPLWVWPWLLPVKGRRIAG